MGRERTPAAGARLVLLAFVLCLVAAGPATAATRTYTASADAYVDAANARTNFGSRSVLLVDASPKIHAYLRFKLPAAGDFASVTLRMRAWSRISGLRVHRVRNANWRERAIRHANAPGYGPPAGRRVSARKGRWVAVDITSLVDDGGVVSLALTTTSHRRLRLAAREAGWRQAPRLIVRMGEKPAAPPSPEPPRPSPPPPSPPPPPASPPSVVTDPAPNCIGEPAGHPAVSYPEPRVFLEAQGWWDDRDDDGHVARFGDSEHLHIGLCFPLQQTVSGTIRLDLRVVGHNLPAGSLIRNTRFHDASGQLFEDVRYERRVAAGEVDAVVWKTLNWGSAEATDGLREIRFLTFVDRPDGAEIHASSGWCVDFENGKTDSNYSSCSRRLTEGRGWYDCMEYKVARFDEWTYPYGGVPAGQPYAIRMTGQDGAPFGGGGDDAVTRHWLRVDPAFHSANLGTLVFEHAGAHRDESITIPGALLTPGVRRLFLMTERDGRCAQISSGTLFDGQKTPQDGIISGGLSVPIKVNP